MSVTHIARIPLHHRPRRLVWNVLKPVDEEEQPGGMEQDQS